MSAEALSVEREEGEPVQRHGLRDAVAKMSCVPPWCANPSGKRVPRSEKALDPVRNQGLVSLVANAGFEKARMKELGQRFGRFKIDLEALSARVVDLLPIARDHYYHPSQEGSWSIKKVLPAAVRDLRYESLDGVQDGEGAMAAYLESIASATDAERKAVLQRQLLAYCRMDTYAMVRLWQVFAGRDDLRL